MIIILTKQKILQMKQKLRIIENLTLEVESQTLSSKKINNK